MDFSYFDKQINNMYGNTKNYIQYDLKMPSYDTFSTKVKRGGLDRVFDVLNVGQYVSAGFAQGMVDDNITPFEGMVQGVMASNPLGKGYDKYEHSYSKVLETAGWKPESLGGKIAKGAVGFVGDVMLDPMTYVSGGLSGVIKGSGKAGAKTTMQIADKLGDSAKFMDNVGDITKGVGLTQEVAEELVKKSTLFTSGKYTIDVAEEGARLAEKYNKLIGVNSKSAEVTLSLANAPLGKKIFGKHAEKSLTLFDSDVVKAFGDSTVAPYYSKLRDGILGSKIGELFSTNHALFKHSRTNPEEVYKFIKMQDFKTGTGVDKMVSERLLRESAKELLNLTPAETNEVLEAMQDKTIMHKVKTMLNFDETKEAMMYKQKLEAGRKATEETLNDVIKNYDILEETIQKSGADVDVVNKQIEAIKKQKALELLNINNSHARDLDKLEDVIYQYEKMAKEFTVPTSDDISNLGNKWKGMKGTIESTNMERRGIKSVSDVSEALFGDKDIIGYQSSQQLHSILDSLTRGGKANITPEAIDELILLAKNNGVDGLNKDTIEKYMSVFKAGDTKALLMETVDELSTSLFGKKGMISYNILDSSLDDVFKLAERGAGHEELVNFIYANKANYSGQAAEMYSFIGSQMGYGRNAKVKDWNEMYTKPRNEILEIYKSEKKLSRKQWTDLAELEQENLKRATLVNEFKGANSVSDVKNIIGSFNTELTTPSVEDIRETLYRGYNIGKSPDEILRDSILVELGQDDYTGGVRKATHKPKKFNTDVKLSPEERSIAFDHFLDKYGEVSFNNDLYAFIKSNIKNSHEVIVGSKRAVTDLDKEIAETIQLMGQSEGEVKELIMDNLRSLKNQKHKFEYNIKYHTENVKEFTKIQIPTTKSTELTSKTQAKKFNEYIDDLERILQSEGLSFGNIDVEDRVNYFLRAEKFKDTGIKNHEANALKEHIEAMVKSKKPKATSNVDQSKYRFGKKIVDGKVVDIQKEIKTLDDISDVPELFERFIGDKIDYKRELDTAKSKVESLKGIRATQIEEVSTRFDNNLKSLESSRVTLETKLEDLVGKLNKSEVNAYTTELAESIAEYDNLLNNSDAFESYVRLLSPDGTFSNMDDYNSKLGDYILDIDDKLSPKSKEAVDKLRGDFIKMGMDEVEIGKLDIGQLEANKFDYLPHILTPEGEKLFANKDIQATIAQFGDDFGYGKEYNPHGMSRTIKVLPDGKGGWINKPTIQEINNHFRELAGGNVFSEDLSEIYLARALKHSDLMYDHKYMEDMLELFGDNYDGVLKKDYGVAINYGMLKQTTSQVSRGHTALDISDAISEYLTQNEIFKLAESEAEKLWELDPSQNVKKLKNDIINKYISEFMKTTLTDDVRNKMYAMNLDEFLINTNTFGALNDIALPLTNLDDTQIDGMNNSVKGLRDRLDLHIKKSIASLSGTKLNSSSAIMDMNMEDISSYLNNALSTADEIDASRIQRIIKKVDEFNKIQDPQIKQLQNAMIEKANMSRQLQITRDSSDLLTMYDKFTHFVKLQQTAVLPGFHARNKQSNLFNNWLAVGQDATRVDFQKSAYNALTGSEKALDDMLEIIGKDGSVTKMKWSDILIEAENYGAVDKGIFAKDIGSSVKTKGLFNNVLPGKFDPTNTGNFLPYQIGTRVGNTIENHDRLIHFASQVKNGMSFQDAAESVNKFLFDYGELTSFEHNVMKRIFPYYTWMRKNGALQLEMILDQPEKYRMVSKVLGGIENTVNQDERINKFYVNEFAQDWIQTPFSVTNPDGRLEPVLWNPNLPFMDIGRIPDPSKPIDSIKEAFTQTNPLIKLPVELAMNRNLFFDSPIAKEGESRVSTGLKHIGGQFGVVPIAEGLVNKTGADFGLHVMSNTTGVKMLSYDYDKYKAMKIQELSKKRVKGKSNPGILDSIKRRLGNY